MTRLQGAGLLALVCISLPAHAAKLQLDEKTTLNIGYLLQSQAVVAPKAAADGESLGTDLFIRRSRIILSGSWNDKLSFFVETDQPNLGKDAKFKLTDSPIYLQDVYATFKVNDALMIDTGLILLPFTHQGMQGAVSLNTLDYHSALIKYAPDSTLVWRDTGVQVRGQVLEGKLHYRVGVFNGTEGVAGQTDSAGNALNPLNPSDKPRLAGRVHYSILGKENDFFLKGIYFAKDPIVTVGLGGNYQPQVFRITEKDSDGNVTGEHLADELSLGFDAFVDYPINEKVEVIAQANYFMYQHDEAASAGSGVFAEAGVRFGKVEPLVYLDQFTSASSKADVFGVHAGVNYWIKEHGASVKLDLGPVRTGDFSDETNEAKLSATLQAQLLF